MTQAIEETRAPSRRAAVYRLYDAEGTLLYIGSAYDPERRYRQHGTKPWWPLVARRAEEWHPSKAEAYAAEMKAIAAEEPAHNHMGTPQYVPPSEKAAAQRSHIVGELTVKELMAKHRISRQSLHTYRKNSSFPLPVSRPGTGGLRWLETEVAAWFEANPKQQGRRTDLATKNQQGEPMITPAPTTVDPRIAVLSAVSSPEWHPVPEAHGMPWDDAVQLLDAYRASVVAEVVEALNAKGAELSELAEEKMQPSIEERAQTWYEAAAVAETLKQAKGASGE